MTKRSLRHISIVRVIGWCFYMLEKTSLYFVSTSTPPSIKLYRDSHMKLFRNWFLVESMKTFVPHENELGVLLLPTIRAVVGIVFLTQVCDLIISLVVFRRVLCLGHLSIKESKKRYFQRRIELFQRVIEGDNDTLVHPIKRMMYEYPMARTILQAIISQMTNELRRTQY